MCLEMDPAPFRLVMRLDDGAREKMEHIRLMIPTISSVRRKSAVDNYEWLVCVFIDDLTAWLKEAFPVEFLAGHPSSLGRFTVRQRRGVKRLGSGFP